MVFYSEGLAIKQNPFEGLICTSSKRQFNEFWCGIEFINFIGSSIWTTGSWKLAPKHYNHWPSWPAGAHDIMLQRTIALSKVKEVRLSLVFFVSICIDLFHQ